MKELYLSGLSIAPLTSTLSCESQKLDFCRFANGFLSVFFVRSSSMDFIRIDAVLMYQKFPVPMAADRTAHDNFNAQINKKQRSRGSKKTSSHNCNEARPNLLDRSTNLLRCMYKKFSMLRPIDRTTCINVIVRIRIFRSV
jgi:hypothetical protein